MNGKADSKWCFVMVTIFLAGAGGQANAEFVLGPPANLGPAVNSPQEDVGPSLSADGLSLYFSSRRPDGSNSDIWVSTRATTEDDWSAPVSVGPTVNTSAVECFPSISADGLELYFGDHPSGLQPGGYGSTDIWVTRRADVSDDWGAPVNLGPVVNTSSVEGMPAISADGLSLFFSYEQSGQGSGNWEIAVTTRATTDGEWAPPQVLGPPVSSGFDGWPSISADGLMLFFGSNRPGGSGGTDLWVARRSTTEEPWEAAFNLGPIVNSSAADATPHISPDGSTLYFSSNRAGGYGNFDLWQASITPIVDFNGDGKVDGKEVLTVAEHWGQDEPLCDIAPAPIGDDTVDVKDLAALAEYIGKEVVDPTLMAHWPLDESEGTLAFDSVGENDATVMGGAIWRPDGGQVGGALALDGVDDSVVTDFVVNPVDGPFSVSVWVKGGAPGQVAVAQADGTRPGAAWISADPSGGKLMSNLMFPLPPLVSDVVIADGQWHRVVLTWDGQRRQLYVDETSAASDLADLPATIPSDGGLRFGADKNATPGSFFCGLIDDVRIYNRAVKP